MKIGNYSKLIVSVLLSASTVLQAYPHVEWQQVVTAAIGSALVWLVPNAPLSVKTVTPPKA